MAAVHQELNSKEDFQNALKTQDKYVLIYAHESTVPERAEQYAKQFTDKVASFQVDVSKHTHVKNFLGVSSFPSVVVFKNGEKIQTADGAKPEDMKEIAKLFV